jgi:uncharacterized protein YndB with AHSA1/START domain
MYSSTVTGLVPAPRDVVYRALLDPDALAQWRVPDGMRGEVHELEARVGGRIRMSLTYDDPASAGKSGGATDTFSGRFVELVEGERVVEELEFEAEDDAMGGRMTMTTILREAEGGTEVEIRHDGIPDAVPPDANETGTRMALDKLARLVGLRA